LIVIVGGRSAEMFVRGRLIVYGDAAATAHNIMTHQLLYRLGFTVEVFYLACNAPLTIVFYCLFKVMNKNLALLEAIFGLMSTAIEIAEVALCLWLLVFGVNEQRRKEQASNAV
jgi:hypothetical protein